MNNGRIKGQILYLRVTEVLTVFEDMSEKVTPLSEMHYLLFPSYVPSKHKDIKIC